MCRHIHKFWGLEQDTGEETFNKHYLSHSVSRSKFIPRPKDLKVRLDIIEERLHTITTSIYSVFQFFTKWTCTLITEYSGLCYPAQLSLSESNTLFPQMPGKLGSNGSQLRTSLELVLSCFWELYFPKSCAFCGCSWSMCCRPIAYIWINSEGSSPHTALLISAEASVATAS